MTNPARLPTPAERLKRAKLVELLDDGIVFVTLITGVEGVDLLAAQMANPTMNLHLSRSFSGALELGPLDVRATLSFGSEFYDCVVPYASILDMTSGVAADEYAPTHCEVCKGPPWADQFGNFGCLCGPVGTSPSGLISETLSMWEAHLEAIEDAKAAEEGAS